MNTFEVTIQDPTQNQRTELGTLTGAATMRAYEAIDWLQWGLVTCNPDIHVYEHFYFFEARLPGERLKQPTLCVSGQVRSERELQAEGPMCQIDYFFLETKIRTGFLGFGGGKSKQVLSQKTMQDCSVEFAQTCLQAFVDGDHAFLATHVLDNATSDDD
jgi:hypothetical protein